jgi:hypothetical protein
MSEAIESPNQVTDAATKGCRKDVAFKLGKKLSTLEKMCEDPERDRFSRFVQLFLACDQAGREIFIRYLMQLNQSTETVKAGDWSESADGYFRTVGELSYSITREEFDGVLRRGPLVMRAVGDLVALSRKEKERRDGSRHLRNEMGLAGESFK